MQESELQQYLLRNYPQENACCEWKEFKNLKNSFCGDEKNDVISYVSAIANMEGGDVAQYINPIRKRAYGASWNEATDAYVNGDFTQNELAILAEKDKEMLGEGQRWYDLNRMMLTKGGDHLVFCKEGSKDGQAPILNKSTEAYKVFWPIETEMLNKDPKLVQTPGYENAAVN